MSNFKIGLLLSYICIATISSAIITPALPQIEASLGLAHGATAWMVSIFLLGYVFGQLLYAPLANRYGKLFALRIGLSINIIGILICILGTRSDIYLLILLGRLVTALGAASGLSCTFMLMRQLLDEEKLKTTMPYTIVSFTLGLGTSVALGGILTAHLGWSACFYFLLVHGILMLILSWQFKDIHENVIIINFSTILRGYLSALSNKTLVSFSLMVGFVSIFAYTYSVMAPIYSQTKLGLTPSTYGYWNILNMVGMLASGFLGSKLLKVIGPKKVLSASLLLILPCILSLFLLVHSNKNTLWFFSTTSCLYLLTGLLFPAAAYYASNAISDKASASSMMSFINMGSALLAVIIMGYLPTPNLVSFLIILCISYGVCIVSLLICFPLYSIHTLPQSS